jgi:hypothetical protein
MRGGRRSGPHPQRGTLSLQQAQDKGSGARQCDTRWGGGGGLDHAGATEEVGYSILFDCFQQCWMIVILFLKVMVVGWRLPEPLVDCMALVVPNVAFASCN